MIKRIQSISTLRVALPALVLLFVVLLFTSSVNAQAAKQFFPVNSKSPTVDEPNPALSFWRDQVHYPFPVQYAKAADSQGTLWEIAYMDEYAGPVQLKEQAKTLVLIHGRGTNAGTWREMMSVALRNGLRVIALDIPHYGKSIPGNLERPLTRTLDDVREIFHAVIVDQLKVRKATYLGHSLGGQLVFGYALKYPDAVERLIALAPGGLEEFNSSTLLDRSYARDFERWNKVWQNTGMLAREFARAPHMIEGDYYFNGDGRSYGYFFVEGITPRFITDSRKKMIAGNEKEYRNYVTSYVHDAYAVGVELLSSDPGNLNRRLSELKMPVLLLMGDKDPLFPVKTWSGNSDVKQDMIKPFFDRLHAKGNPPQVKIYKDTGHFFFTDVADAVAVDVIAFIDGKTVRGGEDVAAYRTSLLRFFGIQKSLNIFMQKMIMDCYAQI